MSRDIYDGHLSLFCSARLLAVSPFHVSHKGDAAALHRIDWVGQLDAD